MFYYHCVDRLRGIIFILYQICILLLVIIIICEIPMYYNKIINFIYKYEQQYFIFKFFS